MSAKGLFLVVVLFSATVYAKTKQKDFDWAEFIIGSSCSIENLLPGGELDYLSAESCGNCFRQLATAVPSGDGPAVVRNCSATFLPNITTLCRTTLEKETSFDKFWEPVLKCFYAYVKETDSNGDIQRGVKEWMKHHEYDKNWEFL